MGLHRNARLGLAGRRALVADVELGLSCRCAARRHGVSPTTACKWWRRWSQGGCRGTSDACLPGGSLVAAPPLAAAAAGDRAGADLRRKAPLWLGAAVDRRRDRPSARDRLADAALIHGSTEGRFTVRYCPGPGLGRDEIEGVGFEYLSAEDVRARFGAVDCAPGPGVDADGRPFVAIANPGLGLWREGLPAVLESGAAVSPSG